MRSSSCAFHSSTSMHIGPTFSLVSSQPEHTYLVLSSLWLSNFLSPVSPSHLFILWADASHRGGGNGAATAQTAMAQPNPTSTALACGKAWQWWRNYGDRDNDGVTTATTTMRTYGDDMVQCCNTQQAKEHSWLPSVSCAPVQSRCASVVARLGVVQGGSVGQLFFCRKTIFKASCPSRPFL